MAGARSSRTRARDVVAALVDACNRHDVERTADLCIDDVRLWTPSWGLERGKERVAARCFRLFEQAPDAHLVADTVVTDGATIVVELSIHRTGASGRRHTAVVTAAIELDGDRIRELRAYFDPEP